MPEQRKPRVLICDKIGKEGVEALSRVSEVLDRSGISKEDLLEAVGDVEAIIVRSQTKITAEVIEHAPRLMVIGRAGVGVDNIDVDAATARGVVVVNSPEGNTRAAAEHAVALLLALSRNIMTGDARIRARDWSRSGLMGNEVRGKTLGLVGLGRVGIEVARMGRGLGMRVLAHDVALSAERCRRLEVEPCDFETVIRESDFISVHVPLNPQTKGMIGAREFAMMRPTTRLVNCSRGAVVDEAALAEALNEGRLAGAAIDVFESEPEPPWESPLMGAPHTVLTPHLGASTEEAQTGAAMDVATQVIDVLGGRPPSSPVNLPNIPAETFQALRPWLPLMGKMGRLASYLAASGLHAVEMKFSGALAEHDCRLLTRRFLAGLLARVLDTPVNDVNAMLVADERHVQVTEAKQDAHPIFQAHVEARVVCADGTTEVEGSLRGIAQPRVVGINGYSLDVDPTGTLVLVLSPDRPGDFAKVASVLGNAGLNIRQLSAGRRDDADDRTGLLVMGVDGEVTDAVVAKLEAEAKPLLLGVVELG